MPVRNVSNRGRRNVIGYFPSLKMHRMVQFESTLERDLIYLLDFAPQVAEFEEQPLKLEYEYEGKILTYTPDFQVKFRNDQRSLLECKPACFVGHEENQRKFKAAQAWCWGKGWRFQVITDEQLRQGYQIENIKLLTQHARHEVKAEAKGRIFAFLAYATQPLTISDVMLGVNPANPATVIMPILHMAYHHELHLPLKEAPITPQSSISLNASWQPMELENEYRTIFDE